MDRIKGKIALVTGGSRGIGRAIVDKLASEGAEMVISCGQGPAVFEQNNVRHITLNVTDRSAVAEAVKFLKAEFGRVDILVNNAGITKDSLLARMSEEQWDDVINVNLKGVFNLTQAIAPLMTKNKYGSIINITSVVGLFGNLGQTNYSAAKAGVIGMTKTWAKELARKGANIRANCIAPGFIETDMTATLPEKTIEAMLQSTTLGRLGKPEDIANAVLFLASDESSFMTGETLNISGGIIM